jgi:hypothetical protein
MTAIGGPVMRKWTLAALFFFGIIHPAGADAPVKAFLQEYESASASLRETMESFVFDLNEGMGWLNDYLATTRHEPRVYCPPDKLTLTGNQLVEILKKFVQRDQQYGDYPVGAVLVYALKDVFPCPE